MIVAQNHPRRPQSTFFYHQPPYSHQSAIKTITPSSSVTSTPPQQPLYYNHNNNNNIIHRNSDLTTDDLFSFAADQALFDYQTPQYPLSPSQPLMKSEPSTTNNSWLSNGQLTPISTKRARHHRESSLSSLGSAGPASPYTANTSNPQVAGDIYHDFSDYPQASSKPMTPSHTPSQEQFLASQYSNYYPSSHNLGFNGVGHDGLPVASALMPGQDYSGRSGRPSTVSLASHDDSRVSTPPSFEDERQKKGETSNVDFWLNEYLRLCDDQAAYRSTVPKLTRTMTDIYADELYNPTFQITSAPPAQAPVLSAASSNLSTQNDIFSQRLQAANSQHLSASNTQVPLNNMPSRERSPFRQGSPLAPSGNGFGPQRSPNLRFGTAAHMREQQKAENDARLLLQQQLDGRAASQQTTPKTISPKDVELTYHEDEDSNMPLFPPQPQRLANTTTPYRQQPGISQEPPELDDSTSQQSYGSMVTSRRESSSAYSTSSHATQQQSHFNFAPPAVPGSVRQIPQQYPFVPQTHRQPSSLSSVVAEEFPDPLTSTKSSSSEYASETGDIKKPARVSADSGTYTCTYHGCTLRFDTPARLQRHKRDGHRNSASSIGVGEDGGMTSAAQNSQAGPHRCERINPSTGKPCNTIFSRPYDLTRHEDTIHNARKQKVRCHLCTEEKTFSRNDALTRHFRVCHPDVDFPGKSRRRRGGIHD